MDADKRVEDAFHKFSNAVDELKRTVITGQQQTEEQKPRAADVINSFSADRRITYEPYEIFRYEDGRMYQCLLQDSEHCDTCSFRFKLCFALNCTAEGRDDGLAVRFVTVRTPRSGMLYHTSDGKKCMLVRAPFDRPCLCKGHESRCYYLNKTLFTGIRCKLMFNLKDWHWVPLD